MPGGGRRGKEFAVHPESKQFVLGTPNPHPRPITANPPTSRLPRSIFPTHFSNSSPTVKLPLFPKPFSSLFPRQNHHHHHRPITTPHSDKGILPLPASVPLSVPEEGWTTVVHRKKLRRLSRPPPPPPRPPKCFFCHQSTHMARDCPEGDFICFLCHGMGHISRDCPLSAKSKAPPPIPAESINLIDELSSFAIFYLAISNPSISELRDMLAYRFNLPEWNFGIKRAAGTSFLVQFPLEDLLLQALDLKLIDMGSFNGRFFRWREDLSLSVLPKPFLTWIRLYRMPYHLWNWEFLQALLKDVGECIMCSKDIAFQDHFRDCKVLIKIRDFSDIPKRIRFRYISPADGSLMEGYTVTQIIGKPISERAFEKLEVQEHQNKWEGNTSSESGWVDRGSPDEVVDQVPPTECRLSSPERLPQLDKGKGNLVISPTISKVAGVSERGLCARSDHINLGPHQQPSIATVPDLIDLGWSQYDSSARAVAALPPGPRCRCLQLAPCCSYSSPSPCHYLILWFPDQLLQV